MCVCEEEGWIAVILTPASPRLYLSDEIHPVNHGSPSNEKLPGDDPLWHIDFPQFKMSQEFPTVSFDITQLEHKNVIS